jgi:hypothetical protein
MACRALEISVLHQWVLRELEHVSLVSVRSSVLRLVD